MAITNSKSVMNDFVATLGDILKVSKGDSPDYDTRTKLVFKLMVLANELKMPT